MFLYILEEIIEICRENYQEESEMFIETEDEVSLLSSVVCYHSDTLHLWMNVNGVEGQEMY